MTNIDKAAALLHQRSKGLLGVDSDAARRACQEHAQALALLAAANHAEEEA